MKQMEASAGGPINPNLNGETPPLMEHTEGCPSNDESHGSQAST